MKKTLLLAAFTLAALSVSASDLPNRSLYIEGTAGQKDHAAFFMDAFRAQAIAMGLSVRDHKSEAGYTFHFHVQSPGGEYEKARGRYLLSVYFFDNETGVEMVSFGWHFEELEEMHEHNPLIFHMAAALIPGLTVEEEPLVVVIQEREADERWRNQQLSLRVSVNYAIIFYLLQPDGLIGGIGVYDGPNDSPIRVQHIDHIIMPRPGITVGVEWIFHRHLGVALNFQGHLGDPDTYRFFNMAAGLQLKGVFRPGNFMLKPYAAISVPLNVSPEFSTFPRFAAGGGAQVSVKGIGAGSFFLDAAIMFTPGKVSRYNPYGDWAPNPSRIKYRHFVVTFGIGYRFGILQRR